MDQATRKILDFFEWISQVPRCPGNEVALADKIRQWADDLHLTHRTDATGNICIDVPATAGAENAPPLIIQGHMDMVCEKVPASNHNFASDPIKLIYEGDWVRADSTSLGADNGIALALAMTLLDEQVAPRPSLELLFTVEEEIGLVGADQLSPDFLKGRRLLNLDSEDEGIFTIGCAGGLDTRIALDLEAVPPSGATFCTLAASGLLGGHSGVDIHRGRASGHKILARALDALCKIAGIGLVHYQGGTVKNAICRDAQATVVCPDVKAPEITAAVEQLKADLKVEYQSSDPGLALTCDFSSAPVAPGAVISSADTQRVVSLLMALPHGVAAMVSDDPNLVETSCNLARVDLEKGRLRIVMSQRSLLPSRLTAITDQIHATVRLAGATASNEGSYPPWAPDPDSMLTQRCTDVYQALFGDEPRTATMHAGLECAVIGQKFAGMDMISFGPDIEAPHSPQERMRLSSVERTWRFLVVLVQALADERQ